MAETEYPQRWLKEHKAVASAEGWRRPTTQELLKCQKGLDLTPPEPTLKTVSTSGVPTTLELDETGSATYTFSYSFTDVDYVPLSVTCESTSNGSATVTNVKQAGNEFKVDVTGGTVDEIITVKVTIDTVSSTNRNTTLVNNSI